ncbi:MAG: hypothetical protein K8S23_09620, partial [Candidatus Cloacimonetes bacterium]|nr:hypothetical protein [Candidatus Cloacimonadota bacterium]
MRNNLLFIFITMFFVLINNGFAVQMQKTIIDMEKGYQIITIEKEEELNPVSPSIIENRDQIQLLWQGSDASAITGRMKVSSATENSFVSWDCNNERCALYPDYFYPLWQSEFDNCTYDFSVDMIEDGTI